MDHRYRATSNGNKNFKSLYDNAGFFSRYAFLYMVPLFARAFKKEIDLDDVGAPPEEDQSKLLGIRLQQAWQQEILTKNDPSFTRAVIKVFGSSLALFSIWDFISKCVAYPMQAVALGWLIRAIGEYINETSISQTVLEPVQNLTSLTLNNISLVDTTGQTIAQTAITTPVSTTLGINTTNEALDTLYNRIIYNSLLLILFTGLAPIAGHPFMWGCYHLGMKCRIASCYVIYKKSLRLSQSAMSQTTMGQMVNLLSNDVNRFDQGMLMLPYLIMAPLQALVMLALLAIYYLGVYPTLAALLTIVSYVLLQTCMGRCFSRMRAKTAKRTDERVRLVNEIVSAIRVIKMYAWEKSFESLVSQARSREINCIGKTAALRTINTTLFFVSSKIIIFVALMTYISLGYAFTPENVFVSIALANLVRVSLTLGFPNAVAQTAETLISCQRIKDFLLLPEIDRSHVSRRVSSDSSGCKYVVEFSRVTASWPSSSDKSIPVNKEVTATNINLSPAILRGLTFTVSNRDLLLIVGRVGSGKSSVLMSILGELPIASGRLEINGRLSYASQEAWIFSGTIRENVLFGKSFNSARYKEVFRVCNLDKDMELFPDADRSIVGERGVSLSGGQKARVNLARALYNEADIYLLDDPLSAVDASVAKHIFNNCLKTFLKKKTVILATHQLQFLCHATKVLVVDSSLPSAFGTLQEVMASKAFAEVNYSREAFEDATTTATEEVNDESGTDTVLSSSFKSASESVIPLIPLARINPQLDQMLQTATSALATGKTDMVDEKTIDSSTSLPGKSAAQLLQESIMASVDPQTHKRISPQKSSASTSSSSQSRSRSRSRTPLDNLPPGSSDNKSTNQAAVNLSYNIRMSSTSSELIKSLDTKQPQSLGTGISSADRQAGEKLSKISADLSTYIYYVGNAAGIIFFSWFILTNITTQTLFHMTDFWLSFWTDSEQRKEAEGANFVVTTLVDDLTLKQISLVYTGLVAAVFVASFFRTATFYIGCLRASINLHNSLFTSILKAPMTFFDFSPTGILLNRISRDIGFVDDLIPTTGMEIVMIFVNISGIIIVTLIIDYWNIFPAIFLLSIAFMLRHFSARSVRRLKQIEGVTRSPIFTHLSTTLSGISTIRAFGVQDDFMKKFDDYQDTHSSSWFLYISSGRWLTVAMDWLCFVFITTLISILVLVQFDGTNASLIGLLVSQAVMLPDPFQWGMRQLTELESQMTSVQRIKEFSELPPELELEDEGALMPGGNIRKTSFKPSEGEIMFCGVTLRYFKEEDPVLRNLNFHIKPREKIGIVGRTGAGKSSIMAVLFRLYNFDGSIFLDSKDTKSLSLSELRQCISMIPQDPILFSGSLRKNLDPFGEYPDRDLWASLEAVRLKQVFAQTSQGLDYHINEGGSNFSIGQRQLICLARAIARKNKILVLDEATANVDPETDIFIQKTIRDKFSDCTVLTIAHRLITVMDSDRLLVLDAGQVREFDEPYKLLQNENGVLTKMTNNTGQQADRLRKIAYAAHIEKNKTK